ncbi:MAG: hypothetical protein ABF969_04230 [Sporolactobacillus sp.]
MGFSIEDDHSGYDRIMHEFAELDHLAIEIGIFGDGSESENGKADLVTIASVQEFGMTIRAKKRFMIIPLAPKYKQMKPSEVKGLFHFTTKEGTNYLVREKGKDELEFCYLLAKQVTVPERSFLRSTFDEKNEEWTEFFETKLEKVCALEMTAKDAYTHLGAQIVGDIQKKIRDLREPALSPITIAGRQRQSTNPLMDTGHLRESITWKVVKDDADV